MFNLGSKAKPKAKVKSKIALDIGAHTLKMLKTEWPGQKPTLVTMGIKRSAGLKKEALSEAIKAMAEELGIVETEANIAIAGSSVVIRFITMPKMKEADLRNAIKFEAEKFVPFNMTECALDFQMLKNSEPDNKLNVILVAAKRELVDYKINAVEAAGFTVDLIDVDSLAVSNAFLQGLPEQKPDKTIALLNIGASSTNLSILRGESIAFVRDIGIGGNDFTEAISKSLNMNFEAAEELKISPKERSAEVQNSVKGVIDDLLDDVKLSFSYHENQSGRSIDEIYVSGGSSNLLGLADVFQEMFGSKPSAWDPLSFMDTGSAKIDPATAKMKNFFAVAAGLALR